MNSIQKTVLASLVAASLGVVAVPAAATGLVPVLLGITTTEIDEVQVNTLGFDLAESGLAFGAALTPAKVNWEQSSSGATSKVIGSIYFDGVSGDCARVQVTSYDDSGDEILPKQYSTEPCADTNAYQEAIITDLTGNPYLQGNPGASEVRVRLQNLLINGNWNNLGADTVYYGPTLGTSEVLIEAPHYDLGVGAFAGGTYLDPATVTWSVDGANLIKANTVGSLAMKNVIDHCGRIRYTYLNDSPFVGFPDVVLGTQYGTTHCVTNNSLHEFTINPNPGTAANAFSYAGLDKVEIAIEESSYDVSTQASTGNWIVVGELVGTPAKVTVNLPSAP